MSDADGEPAVALPLPPLTPNTHRSTREVGIETAVVFSVCILPGLIGSIASQYLPPDRTPPDPFFYQSLTTVIHDSGRIALVLYLIFRSGEPLSRFGLRRFGILPDLFGAIGIYILLRVSVRIVFIVLTFLEQHSLMQISHHNYGTSISPAGLVDDGILVLMCLTIGFSEELMYRAYFITRFEQLFESTGLALLFSDLLFGGVHIYQGEHGFISAAITGLLYGSIFCLFRRLWPIAIAHAIWDFVIYARMH
jgi:membrane protease YdiL (CAAX protease family)